MPEVTEKVWREKRNGFQANYRSALSSFKKTPEVSAVKDTGLDKCLLVFPFILHVN